MKELVTVRRNRSITGRYDVLLEKGHNKAKIEVGLSEFNAVQVAKNLARQLKTEIKTYLL